MKFSVSPVVRVAVEPKNAADLPKLVERLKLLAKSDPMVQVYTAPNGEYIVACTGERHLEGCLNLGEDFMNAVPIRISEPIVLFCETVSKVSDMQCVSKSPNKHNRFYMVAEPLDEKLAQEIDDGNIKITDDPKTRARRLADEFGWDIQLGRKIWSFGCPRDGEANILVDATKAVQYLSEIKDSMCSAFIQTALVQKFCSWKP
jgi:elongation factor 2